MSTVTSLVVLPAWSWIHFCLLSFQVQSEAPLESLGISLYPLRQLFSSGTIYLWIQIILCCVCEEG